MFYVSLFNFKFVPSLINYFEQPLFCNEGRIPCEYYPKDFKRKASTGAAPRVTLPNIRASLGNNLHQVTIKYFVLIASKRWLGTGTVLARLFGLDWSHSQPPPRARPLTPYIHPSHTRQPRWGIKHQQPLLLHPSHTVFTSGLAVAYRKRFDLKLSPRRNGTPQIFIARQILSFRSPFQSQDWR